MQGGLNTATIQRRAREMRFLKATLSIGEEQGRVAVGLPEAAQDLQGVVRQGHKAVAIAFGVAHLHAHPIGINIADVQAQAFTQPKTQAVQREEKYAITEHPRRHEYLLRLLHGENIR